MSDKIRMWLHVSIIYNLTFPRKMHKKEDTLFTSSWNCLPTTNTKHIVNNSLSQMMYKKHGITNHNKRDRERHPLMSNFIRSIVVLASPVKSENNNLFSNFIIIKRRNRVILWLYYLECMVEYKLCILYDIYIKR